MAIASVVQRSFSIYIYDEKGRQLGIVAAGSDPNDGLEGYTNSTVSVRRGNSIYIYDEKGRQKTIISAPR
jgi:hypothetical protein